MKLDNFQNVYSIEEIEAQVIQSFPYESFFKGQKEAIIQVVDTLLNSGKKHVLLEAPTGSGKTLIAWTTHRTIDKLLGKERLKTTVTTTTKGLQKQYVEDCDTQNLMGKTNYPCQFGHTNYGTIGCKHHVSQRDCRPAVQCQYVRKRIKWTETAYWRSTNTAMFIQMCPILCMTDNNKSDLIVLDECHKLPDSLCDHTEVSFNPSQLEPVNIFHGSIHPITIIAKKVFQKLNTIFSVKQKGTKVQFPKDELVQITAEQLGRPAFDKIMHDQLGSQYSQMLANHKNCDNCSCQEIKVHNISLFDLIYELNEQLNEFLDVIEKRLKETEHLDHSIRDICERVILRCQDWSDTCELITDCGIEDFILQDFEEKNISFKPLLPSQVSNYSLFRKGDYFLHMSATICGIDAYAEVLGIKKEDYHGITMDHPVDVERRQINYIPTVNMGGGYSDEKARTIAKNVSELMEHHENENGLVHTSSYKLAEAILAALPEHQRKKAFIGRNRESTMTALRLERGVICLSPSMEEGYDLKYDLARWQVIAKIPYGFLGDPKIKYVSAKIPGSYARSAVLRVVQASGRVVRGADDQGITYILDSGLERLLVTGDDYFPKWWNDSLIGFE